MVTSQTAFLFADVVSFNEDTDMLHISIPMGLEGEGEDLPVGCANDDLDSDDSQIALQFFQVLIGQYLEGAEMVGKRFKLVVPRN